MFNWNHAYGELNQTAVFKQGLADFCVIEELSFAPSGEGEHLYLRLRKADITTQQVRKQLQQIFQVPAMDVSFAGLKDRHGICEQWFSVRAPQGVPEVLAIEGVDELERSWHISKLRRGQIEKNYFKIRLREANLSESLNKRFQLISKQGVPNYFGPQRFGYSGENIPASREWLAHRRSRRIDPFLKGIYLSTLRSLLFNSVLSARVAAGNWNQLVPGDVETDGFPSGPLWGRGRSASDMSAAKIEQAALVEFSEICADLEYAGVNQARRTFVLMPQKFTWAQVETGVIELNFALTSGGYATVLLQECLRVIDSSRMRAA